MFRVTSKAASVDQYLQELPDGRREAFEKLRALCRTALAGHEECMEYGMPCYKRDGVVEVSFASQKQYIALYVLKKAVLDEFRGQLGASSIGKGCIRFARPDLINFTIIEQMLVRNAASGAPSC
jgi:uncharacterized protein YdhG (YjbR/CyaY superfamily)